MMDWLDVLGTVIGVTASITGIICLPILGVKLIDHIIKSIRKEKHPEYFELYDTAVSESFRIGGKFSAEKNRIKYYLELYSDGYRDGECTKESFEKKMSQLIQMYLSSCDEYNAGYVEVKRLLEEADTYAKKNNLKWGIIYDT